MERVNEAPEGPVFGSAASQLRGLPGDADARKSIVHLTFDFWGHEAHGTGVVVRDVQGEGDPSPYILTCAHLPIRGNTVCFTAVLRKRVCPAVTRMLRRCYTSVA